MITDTIQRFNYLLDTLPAIFEKISEQEFNAETGENKWTKKQVLGHLIDSAANNHQRFIRAQYENVPIIFYDADTWNALNRYKDLPLKHVVQFWTIYNRHLLELMKAISEKNLSKLCNSGGVEPVTLQFLIEDYVHHLEHHLKQITDYN